MTIIPIMIKEGNKKFYHNVGSLQYFSGDVERIIKELRKRKIKYRVKYFKGINNVYIIYINRQNFNINNMLLKW